jgi:hypothetical protein
MPSTTVTLRDVKTVFDIIDAMNSVMKDLVVEALDYMLPEYADKPNTLEDIQAKVQQLTPEFQSRFCTAVLSADRADRISASGKSYSKERTLELALWNLKSNFESLRELAQSSYSEEEVLALLKAKQPETSKNHLEKRIAEGSLLGVRDADSYLFPKWQFDEEREDCVLEGLKIITNELNCPDTSKVSWFTNPNIELGLVTPLELLSKKEIALVVEAAQKVGTAMR